MLANFIYDNQLRKKMDTMNEVCFVEFCFVREFSEFRFVKTSIPRSASKFQVFWVKIQRVKWIEECMVSRHVVVFDFVSL
jgi:hypothetical protein